VSQEVGVFMTREPVLHRELDKAVLGLIVAR
jgi:hypothetical protein